MDFKKALYYVAIIVVAYIVAKRVDNYVEANLA